MRYMMFIKHAEDFDMSKVPQSLFGAMDKFISESAKEGVFIDGAGLQPSKAGHRVQLAKGKITTTDGPSPSPRSSSAATRSWSAATTRTRSNARGTSWSFTGCTGRTSRGSAR
jgi:hypothetical protein